LKNIIHLKRGPISLKALHAACLLIGSLAVLSVSELLVVRSSRSLTHQVQEATLNPTALDIQDLGSKTKTDTGNEEDVLSSETKKRMRETFAFNTGVGMREQKNPIRIDIVGDNSDVLQFQFPSMNKDLADGLIRDLGRGDANFWNGIRLMDFSQIVFSGDNFKKIVNKKEIIGYSRDYDKYKEAFLRALRRLQAGAIGGGTT
jgi:hypothetical protein